MSKREAIAESIYNAAPGWENYQYIPFKNAPEVVREQYLREADKQMREGELSSPS